MARALLHRGPDEEGFLVRPGLGLASRRLSIVGLADGQQPIFNEDRSVSVVFNGELFDYVERREELRARGHQFVTHCDTEVIPHLWEDHGEEMWKRLRGQFAIALWDERQRQLQLGRDRFGIAPLFWTRQGDWLLFASEIKGLLASGMISPRPDRRGIDHVFTFCAMPGPRTCFEGVQLLTPGHFLSISPANGNGASAMVRERAFWEMDFPDQGEEEQGESPKRSLSARHIGAKPPIVQDFRDEDVLATYPKLITAAEAPVIDTACAALLRPNAWIDAYGMLAISKLRFYSESMHETLGHTNPWTELNFPVDRAKRWDPLHRGVWIAARVLLAGHLLQAKGDRVAMHSSVEVRYPFLDEDVFDFLAKLHPRWRLRGFRDKHLLRLLAERWVPKSVARRHKVIFRAPLDSFHMEPEPPFVAQLLSEESLRKTGYFDLAAVARWRTEFRKMRPGSLPRLSVEMGLMAVAGTQLWHHLFMGGGLADLPEWSAVPTPAAVEASAASTEIPLMKS